MKRGTRLLIAIGLGFVVYRIAVAVMPTGGGALISLVLGVIVAGSAWALTAPKAGKP